MTDKEKILQQAIIEKDRAYSEEIEVLKRIITARDATIKQLEDKCDHIDEMLDDWVMKENEYIPTSKREKDLANYGWNKCVYAIRESFKKKGIKLK
jgi:predicted RNase H-like nuclease (RuvC/YqgF family)